MVRHIVCSETVAGVNGVDFVERTLKNVSKQNDTDIVLFIHALRVKRFALLRVQTLST